MKISEIKVKLFADHVQDLLLIRVKGGGSIQQAGCIYKASKNLAITMTASRVLSKKTSRRFHNSEIRLAR